MLPVQTSQLAAAFTDAVRALAPADVNLPAVTFERPKAAAHGDLACNIAMQVAKALKTNPRELAQKVVDAVNADPRASVLVAALEIAGPGFINLRLTPAARAEVLRAVLADGDRYGARAAGEHGQVLVEFVSANPTGPLHVGHGRQAALATRWPTCWTGRAGRSIASSTTTTPACRSRRWPSPSRHGRAA